MAGCMDVVEGEKIATVLAVPEHHFLLQPIMYYIYTYCLIAITASPLKWQLPGGNSEVFRVFWFE